MSTRRRPDRRPYGPGPYLLGARLKEGHGDGYPFDVPAVRALERLRLDAPVTFLVGENGAGKSTVIEALAGLARFDVQGGTTGTELGPRVVGRDVLSPSLMPELGPSKPRSDFFLRAESFFNVAARIDGEDLAAVYGGVPLHHQSHGESFLALAANRFAPEGLYVLDEPEAALSVTSVLAFLGVVHRAAAGGAQFVIATHSPILLALPGARIYELSEAGIDEVTWEETEPVRLTRGFLEAPARFLREVLDPG